jgi:membrane-bound inhibitor of C-type lysozyme
MRTKVLCLSILACGISACSRDSAKPPTKYYECREIWQFVEYHGKDTVILRFPDRTLKLRSVASDSGYKYVDDAGNQVENGVLTLAGPFSRPCTFGGII